MNLATRPKIVLLGMITKIPVAGEIWSTLHYLIGLRRLGYDAYYVEAHARTPSMLMERKDDDGSAKAAALIDGLMRRFDLGDRWAFHALHDDGRCYGLSETELMALYRDAALIINFHGSTVPRPEHYAGGRLIYLETDPVQLEIELFYNRRETLEFLKPHRAFFTWGLNFGRPDCQVPLPEAVTFIPMPPAVVTDLWEPFANGPGPHFTTIGNWRQMERELTFRGQVYHWSKHYEFLKFLDLPKRTSQSFELALSSFRPADQRMLEQHGWRIQRALDFSLDIEAYRHYIVSSRGEFTVAKDQNVRLRSGWFSERSTQYLAAGRPVITQETGFSNVLPTGEGLFGFSTMEEIVDAVQAVNTDYARHSRAAQAIAREHFNYDIVLPPLLAELGV